MKVVYSKTIDWEEDFRIKPLTTDIAAAVIANCPRLTDRGFHATPLSSSLYQSIYQKTIASYYLQSHVAIEDVQRDAISNRKGDKPEVCYLDSTFFDDVHSSPEFVAIHDRFAGIKLKPTHWYGPRVYHHGDLLREHIDHPTTHSIGSSLNIFTEGGEPWPLVFRLPDGFAKIFTEPGELTLFEAVRLPHSRPYRFTGKRQFSIFFHFFPEDDTIFSADYMAHARAYEKIM